MNDSNQDDNIDELIDLSSIKEPTIRLVLTNKEVMEAIHDTVIDAFKSYGGNWIIKAFGSKRRDEVFNYTVHRFKNISTSELEKAFEKILDEMAFI